MRQAVIEGNSGLVLRRLLRYLRPKSLETVSEWAAANRVLPPAMSEPGAWRNERTPYLVPIMDDMSESSPVQEVVFMAGAQVGKSEACLNMLGYWMAVAPANIIISYPTEDLSRIMSKQRVRTLIDYTQAVKDVVHEGGHRNEKNTMLQKEFTGGMLMIISMQSAASLRAIPAKYLLMDEMDAAPVNLPGEGDPTFLLQNRQNTFRFGKKMFCTGTPLVHETSRLGQKMEQSDWRRYYVPCPNCDHMHTLEWDNVHWEKGKPETAGYWCPGCGEKFYDYHKDEILPRGEWRMTKPENASPTRRGYQISSLYSPYGWKSLEDIVRRYLDSELDESIRQVWVNTDMGLPYEHSGFRPDEGKWKQNRYKLGKGIHCPAEVLVLTAGVDVQLDRVEVYVYGWGVGERCYAVDFACLYGDLSKRSWWQKEVLPVLMRKYKTVDGRELGVACAATDIGGRWTDEVYRHVDNCNRYMVQVGDRKTYPRRMDIAVQGARVIHREDKDEGIITPRPTWQKRDELPMKVKLWRVFVHWCKLTAYRRINAGEFLVPDRWASGDAVEDDYFAQMVSERLERVARKDGTADYMWVKKHGQRNEALDCANYAYAALKHLRVDWTKLAQAEAKRGNKAVRVPKPVESPVEERGGKVRVVRRYKTEPTSWGRRGGRGRRR